MKTTPAACAALTPTKAPHIAISVDMLDTGIDVPQVVNPFNNVAQKVYILYTPENVANVGADYVQPLGFADLRLHVDATYADGSQSFEQFAQLTDSSFIVNSRLSLAEVQVGPTGASAETVMKMYADQKGWPFIGARVNLRHERDHAGG